MARLAAIVLIAAVIGIVCAAPGPNENRGEAEASNGSIGVGVVSGGRYGSGAFSINHGGNTGGSGHGGQGGNIGTNSYDGQ